MLQDDKMLFDWEATREAIIDEFFKYLSIVVGLSFLLIMWRATQVGFTSSYVSYFVGGIVYFTALSFRKKMSFKVKVAVTVGFLSHSIMTTLHLVGPNGPLPFVWAGVVLFLLTLLGMRKTSIYFALGFVLCYIAIYFGYRTGIIELNYDFNIAIRSSPTWITTFAASGLMIGLLIFFVDKIRRMFQTQIRRISEQLQTISTQRDEIEYLANHDQLTILPTIRLSRDRAEMVMKNAKRADKKSAILFLDLDGFKAINDGHGHDAGDHVLIDVASRLTSVLRDSDTACRVGGDEFLIVLGVVESRDDIADVCERLINAIGKPVEFEGSELSIGVSIGAALFPEHGQTFDTLRSKADSAMYGVKKAGRNNYIMVT